jgi:hypothetical protein
MKKCTKLNLQLSYQCHNKYSWNAEGIIILYGIHVSAAENTVLADAGCTMSNLTVEI